MLRRVASRLVRGRWLVPMGRPPIEDGAVWIVGGRVRRVGAWAELRSVSAELREDLGEVVVVPGLVNAHCHLDYTCLAGELPPPRTFTAWIHAINAAKAVRSSGEIRDSWRRGAEMLLRGGVTTVLDIESFPELQPGLCRETPLRVVSYLELIRVRPDPPAAELLDRALAWRRTLQQAGFSVGLSPHAPYSTTAEFRDLCAAAARRQGIPLTMHVAETEEEFEMFVSARGPLYQWLGRNGRGMADCDGRSPVRVVAEAGLLGRGFLAVHLNYLALGDVGLLSRAGAGVVHCPRSHAYFGHQNFPWRTLRRAGIPVCLGTDSLATVRTSRAARPVLDLFEEGRAFARAHPEVGPEEVLRLMTVEAARALGCPGELGELTEGARADLAVLALRPAAGSLPEEVLWGGGLVQATMVGGEWVWRREGM